MWYNIGCVMNRYESSKVRSEFDDIQNSQEVSVTWQSAVYAVRA